jgi:RNA recognition motif-containing protein
MGKKIYVGNLPFSMTNEGLSEMFSKFGAVDSSKIITDRDTGRSKGFGFVEMSDSSAADSAISALNGADHGGRSLTVNEARPMEPREGGSRGGFGGGRGGDRGGDRGSRGGGNRW